MDSFDLYARQPTKPAKLGVGLKTRKCPAVKVSAPTSCHATNYCRVTEGVHVAEVHHHSQHTISPSSSPMNAAMNSAKCNFIVQVNLNGNGGSSGRVVIDPTFGRSLQPKNLIDVDVGETLSVERINGKGNSLLSGIEHSYGEIPKSSENQTTCHQTKLQPSDNADDDKYRMELEKQKLEREKVLLRKEQNRMTQGWICPRD